MEIGDWQGRGRPLNIMNGKEEIEAANIAKRKRVGQQDTPSLKCVSWKQTEQDVSIVLESSEKLNQKDIDPEFTDTEVKVSLADGTRWQCTFNQEIEREATTFSLQGSKVTVKVKKKQPNQYWPSLEMEGKDKKTSVKTESCPQSNGERKDCTVKEVKEPEKTMCPSTHTKPPDSLCKLTYVKHDWFEKDPDGLVINIYVKQINKDNTKVNCEDKRLTVTFSSSDSRFLSNHKGTSENTIFSWCIEIADYVKAEKCNYRVTKTVMEVYLVKKTPRRWCALEASQVKGLALRTSSSAPSPSSSCWVATSKNLANNKTKGITTTDQSKVMFDEMCCSAPASVTAGPAVGSVTNSVPGGITSALVSGSCDGKTELKAAKKSPPPVVREPPVTPSVAAVEKGSKNSKLKLTSKSNKAADTNKETVTQGKPTCMVPPLNKTLAERPQVASFGMTGLDNLGNTCFQNSVLQVLANTRELRDYFLESRFQKDINPDNPLGMAGKLAVAFALLLKVLWSGKHHSYAPAKLKNLIAVKNNLFTGFAQHDAQEFMAFLLDGLHEDLNRVRDKPYTTTVESDGRPDEVVAEEAWEVHKQRNNSFIVDLFQGQYRSKLVCPVCQKVSITFDPFMIVPVPLPKEQRLLPVIFFSKDASRKPVKYILRLPKDGTVEHLKEAISAKTGVNSKDLRVFDAYRHEVHTFFGKGSSLGNVSAEDKIFVCEVLSEKVAGEPVVELVILQRVMVPHQVATRCSLCRRECAADRKLRRCTRCYRTAYCDQKSTNFTLVPCPQVRISEGLGTSLTHLFTSCEECEQGASNILTVASATSGRIFYRSCQKKDWSRHSPMCRSIPAPVGQPFMISLPESQATFSRIVQTVEAYARYSVDVFQPPVTEDVQSPSSPADPASPHSGPVGSTTAMATSSDSDLEVTPTRSICSSLSSGSMTEVETPEVPFGNEMDSGIDTASACTSNSSTSKVVSPEKETDTTEYSVNLKSKTTGGRVPPETPAPKVRYVLGRQQNTNFSRPPFHLKPVNKDGHGLSASTPEGQRLEDKGEEPLDLTTTYYLAMDWKNSDKNKPYVLVQSKDLDYREDSSVQTATVDESNTTTLDECLSLFTEPEVLSPEHAWYCPTCKTHREATKQLSIWRLPHTLIIQLKRFSFRNLLWRDKIDKLVDFPTRGLDMSKFYIGNRPSQEPPAIYDLYGVINHHGGILGGHYTAYGRCPDLSSWKTNEIGWRLFDDSMVSMTSEKQVVTRAAYVLFYRRRSTFVSIPPPLTATHAKPAEQSTGGITSVTTRTTVAASSGMEKAALRPTAAVKLEAARLDVGEKHSEEVDTVAEEDVVDDEAEEGAYSLQEPLYRMASGDGLDNRMTYRTSSSFIDMDAVD